MWPNRAAATVSFVQTEYLPQYDVPALTYNIEGQEEILTIRNLIDLDAEALRAGLTRFVDQYVVWIDDLKPQSVPAKSVAAKNRLILRLESLAQRLYRGIALLSEDRLVDRAFRLANRAMLEQMFRSRVVIDGKTYPRNSREIPSRSYRDLDYKWRPFQLAFQLLTLESTANDDAPDRETVDLIWFPTGGGKTEAYLAVAAFAIFLRRLRHGKAAAARRS